MAKKEAGPKISKSPKYVLKRNQKDPNGDDFYYSQEDAMVDAKNEAERRGFNKVSLQQGDDKEFEFLFYSR